MIYNQSFTYSESSFKKFSYETPWISTDSQTRMNKIRLYPLCLRKC